ncbi:hypothetical protein BDW02DRAFT_582635 [Decorospora gaudefroyi]|uniref:Uncharacterized protein n=1 Tax=Decorospora gaudefroyi TaxID=184978 RepID=A0A6A5K8I4_9PLEO|nr:hypothetical protein BDW02DRAFT_582635 [Decorospora gaudefroyi]
MSSLRNTTGKQAACRAPDASLDWDRSIANQPATEQQAQREDTTQENELPQRETPEGVRRDEPEGHRDDEEDSSEGEASNPENPSATPRSEQGQPLRNPLLNRGKARSTLPVGSHQPAATHGSTHGPSHARTLATGTQDWVAQVTNALWEAEDRGEPEERLVILRERVATANLLLTARVAGGEITGRPSSTTDDASKLLRALNAATPRPRLGDTGKSATPQQVDQWIRDVEGVFEMAAVQKDSHTRTLWALGTIAYPVHRELLMQRFRDGPPKGWEWVKNEERNLVQDPLLTKYDNYAKFFNFVWKDIDSVNTFLLQLSKRESLLPRSFFKTPDDQDDNEAKIAFVWAKIPDIMRREMQRHGGFETIHTWIDFERALRNAETANRAVIAPLISQGSSEGFGRRRGKRPNVQTDQGGKRQDRKPSTQSGRTSPGRSDGGPKGSRPFNPQYSSNRGYGDRRRESSHDSRRDTHRQEDRQEGKQPQPHWKQRNRDNQGRPDKSKDSGKANP